MDLKENVGKYTEEFGVKKKRKGDKNLIML